MHGSAMGATAIRGGVWANTGSNSGQQSEPQPRLEQLSIVFNWHHLIRLTAASTKYHSISYSYWCQLIYAAQSECAKP